MASENFDFGGHIEDDRDVSPSPYSPEEETCLSPKGFLMAHLGFTRANAAFHGLQKLAQVVCDEHGQGIPGIAFDVPGGRFVAITEPHDTNDE